MMGSAQQTGNQEPASPGVADSGAFSHEVDTRLHEAGTHLIADFWGVQAIDSVAELERVVRAAVTVARATLLHLHFHQFPGHGGITGYAMLAESHISVHTWPERDYVAIDVFMCGEHRPLDSLDVLRRAFRPSSESVRSIRRGVGSEPGRSASTSAGGPGDRGTEGDRAIVARTVESRR